MALTSHGGHLGWCERADPWASTVKVPPLGSARGRLSRLLRARLTALAGSALSGEKLGHWARNHRLGRPS